MTSAAAELVQFVDNERDIILTEMGKPFDLESTTVVDSGVVIPVTVFKYRGGIGAAFVRKMIISPEFKPRYDAVRADWLPRGLERSIIEQFREARGAMLNHAATFFRNPQAFSAHKGGILDAVTRLAVARQLVIDEDAINPVTPSAIAIPQQNPTPSAATAQLMQKVSDRGSMVDVFRSLYVDGPQTRSALRNNVNLSNVRQNLDDLKSLGLVDPGTERDRNSEGYQLTILGREVCEFMFPDSTRERTRTLSAAHQKQK